MNLNIETTTQDKFYEVKVGGELDVYTVPELEEVLTPMRQDGTRDIYVNLENVSYMDSTGLGLFVGTLKALNQNDKELYILGVSDRIGRLFEITVLKDLMHVNEGTEVE
ncbi:TPA: anti-sigma factor antagonist [Staphylococcus aureus]|nr:anti-sigma factor antagonist [Staphylococcus aureus]